MFDIFTFNYLTETMTLASKLLMFLGFFLGFGIIALAMYPQILVKAILVIFAFIACFGVIRLLCRCVSISVSIDSEK